MSPSSLRPNILHIFADQFRHDAIGAVGDPVPITPNLDRLCREGTVFSDAYTPSPVCVPARACMTFGRYPSEIGCFDNGYPPQARDDETFMEHLRLAGYRTHGIGKCHFTPDLDVLRGFETREKSEEIVADPGTDDYLSWLHAEGYPHVSEPHGVRGEMYYVPQISQTPPSHHPSQWVGDRASTFLRCSTTQDPEDRPWYLFASFIHPHPPFAPPTPWHKLHRAFDMPLPHLPPGYEALQLFINRFQNRYKYRDRGFDLNLVRCIRAAYHACVSFLDFQVGRILAALEESGQLDNTLILFSADHGELLGDYGCFGKRSMHDASSRIPMIARYPAWFQAGGVCPEPVSLIDLAPTFSEAAAVPPRLEWSGRSLRALVLGSGRESIYSQFDTGENAVYMALSRRWKYVYSAPDQREFVFDRERDPSETRNVAHLPGNTPLTKGLRSGLQEFLAKTGENSNLDTTTADGWKARTPRVMPADLDEGLITQDPPWGDFDIPGYSRGRK